MTEYQPQFADEIAANKAAELAPVELVHLETDQSVLELRQRGAFITELELTSPSTGQRAPIFYEDPDVTKPKLSASHSAVPAGEGQDVGGQHGPLRWSDTHEFPQDDGPNGEKRVALQMKRSDSGVVIAKTFELTGNKLTRTTTISNPGTEVVETSELEHDYYAVPEKRIGEVTINGRSLNELYVSDTEREEDGTLYLRDFDGEAEIIFPDGRHVLLTATFDGVSKYPLLLEVWHRPDTDSLSIEPAAGLRTDAENDGITLDPYAHATLTTTIELL